MPQDRWKFIYCPVAGGFEDITEHVLIEDVTPVYLRLEDALNSFVVSDCAIKVGPGWGRGLTGLNHKDVLKIFRTPDWQSPPNGEVPVWSGLLDIRKVELTGGGKVSLTFLGMPAEWNDIARKTITAAQSPASVQELARSVADTIGYDLVMDDVYFTVDSGTWSPYDRTYIGAGWGHWFHWADVRHRNPSSGLWTTRRGIVCSTYDEANTPNGPFNGVAYDFEGKLAPNWRVGIAQSATGLGQCWPYIISRPTPADQDSEALVVRKSPYHAGRFNLATYAIDVSAGGEFTWGDEVASSTQQSVFMSRWMPHPVLRDKVWPFGVGSGYVYWLKCAEDSANAELWYMDAHTHAAPVKLLDLPFLFAYAFAIGSDETNGLNVVAIHYLDDAGDNKSAFVYHNPGVGYALIPFAWQSGCGGADVIAGNVEVVWEGSHVVAYQYIWDGSGTPANRRLYRFRVDATAQTVGYSRTAMPSSNWDRVQPYCAPPAWGAANDCQGLLQAWDPQAGGNDNVHWVRVKWAAGSTIGELEIEETFSGDTWTGQTLPAFYQREDNAIAEKQDASSGNDSAGRSWGERGMFFFNFVGGNLETALRNVMAEVCKATATIVVLEPGVMYVLRRNRDEDLSAGVDPKRFMSGKETIGFFDLTARSVVVRPVGRSASYTLGSGLYLVQEIAGMFVTDVYKDWLKTEYEAFLHPRRRARVSEYGYFGRVPRLYRDFDDGGTSWRVTEIELNFAGDTVRLTSFALEDLG